MSAIISRTRILKGLKFNKKGDVKSSMTLPQMPVYQYIGWYLASSNSLKTQQYQYLYHPQTMIPTDLYDQISPSFECHVVRASYPFLNPSTFFTISTTVTS